MEQRTLGASGLTASVVGLGCNNFGMKIDLAASRPVIDAAIDTGITFFDTADLYGNGQSEEFLGQVLGPRRKQLALATKFGGVAKLHNTGERWGSREYIHRCIDDSLRRLRTDWIDLYQIHYPDPTTPIGETLETLDALVRQGKVRAIGHSNFSGPETDHANTLSAARSWARFDTAQNEWSLLDRRVEAEVIPACERHAIGLLPYFPLASGLLTGKYRRGEQFEPGTRLATLPFTKRFATDRNFARVEALRAFAEARDHTILELAMSWLAAQPSVASVIAGATTPEQVRANISAAGWRFSEAELAAVDTLASATSA